MHTLAQVVDIVAVNKADGPGLQSALTTVANYTGAMSFIARRHRHWAPKVLAVSAKTGYQVCNLPHPRNLEIPTAGCPCGPRTHPAQQCSHYPCVCVCQPACLNNPPMQVPRLEGLLEEFREELGRGGAIEQGRARQRAVR